MSRRRFLEQTAASLAVVVTGCLATTPETGANSANCRGEWNPTVDADEPTLSAGTETTLHIEVRQVQGMQLRLPIHADDDPLIFPVGVSTPIPSPDRQADVSPPKWYWNECTAVDVGVPVRVRMDAQPTDIEYTIHLIQSLDGTGASTDRTFTITVVDDE